MATLPHDGKAALESQPLVLVVDDDNDGREICAEYLRMSGFRTAEAVNGAVGVNTARELMPDVILMDYAMPVMDGIQAAQCLKLDATTRAIPIVMMTASPVAFDARGRWDGYLRKPCDPRAIVAKLSSLLPQLARG